MSARPVHSSSSNPLRTPDPAPANSPAQNPPRLRLHAGNATSPSLPNKLDPHAFDDANADLFDDDALLLQTLYEQLTALRPPLSARLDDIVDLCAALKNAEQRLRAMLVYHPQAAGLMRLKRSLSIFVKQIDAALGAQQGSNRLDPASLSQVQIQMLCQGLAVCVPPEAGMLFHPDCRQQDALCLQRVTDALLKRAMALGLPDALQANGEVLDILNWLSRALKAGLLIPSAAINLCFEKSLVLMLDWTGGDQCRQLLSDHNVGRCAVQCATVFNQTTLDLHAAAPEGLNDDTSETNGQRLQRCVLNFCSDAVLRRLAAAPVDTVSLLNICNTVKDAIDKRVLADTDPALLPALDRLVKVIAGLSARELLGVEQDCRPLANFSNFLRALVERRVRQELALQTALPKLASAAYTLIDCVNGEAFGYAWPSGQSLSNLISFIKLCDKFLMRSNEAMTTASATAGSSDNVTVVLTREALIEAGTVLTSALQTREVTSFSKPKAVGGLLAGLAYLWQRNLAPRSPALQKFVATLLAHAGKLRGTWNDKSKTVVLPALQTLLELEMVTREAVQPLLVRLTPQQRGTAGQRTMQDLAREIKRLNVVVEVVEPPPPMAVMPAPAKPAPLVAPTTGAERAIPGLTPIRPAAAPAYQPQTTASACSTSSFSTTALVEQPYQQAKKVAKPGRVANAGHSYNASISSSSSSDTAVDDEEPAANKSGRTAATQRENTQKNHRPQKNKASARAGKTAPQGRDAALCNAIVQGKPEQVRTLMGQTRTWPASTITTTLDALMQALELELVDRHIITAMDQFFTSLITAEPKTGRAALTAYFLEHPPQYDGLQKLLAEKKLLPDPRDFDTPQKLLDLLAAMDVDERTRWLTMPDLLSRLQKKYEMGDNLLHMAAKQNIPHVVESLLKLPQAAEMVHQENVNHMTPLIAVVHLYNVNVVRLLLAHTTASAQARRLNTDGVNALMAAAELGFTRVVSLLLANPTAAEAAMAVNKSGANALLLAAQSGHGDVVKLLLDMGTAEEQCRVIGANDNNALVAAAASGHTAVVRHLLATTAGAALAGMANKVGWTALPIAVQNGHMGVVRLLLAQPSATAQSIAVNKWNFNALMLAAQEDRDEAARLLLVLPSAAEQVSTVSKNGQNALMVAAHNGHANGVSLLLGQPAAAAQICAQNPQGSNALILATLGGHTETVRLLLAHPSAAQQARTKAKNGANALTVAAQCGYVGITSLLLGIGTAREQVSAVLEDGENALMLAAQNGHTAVIRLLLTHADTMHLASGVDSRGCNALMLAADADGGEEMVKLLLTHPSAESQVGAVMDNGLTALKAAVNMKSAETVRLLLTTRSGRAQADHSTAGGNALFKFAEKIGDPAIIALLRQAQQNS
jgi:ankyrin repeat protein